MGLKQTLKEQMNEKNNSSDTEKELQRALNLLKEQDQKIQESEQLISTLNSTISNQKSTISSLKDNNAKLIELTKNESKIKKEKELIEKDNEKLKNQIKELEKAHQEIIQEKDKIKNECDQKARELAIKEKQAQDLIYKANIKERNIKDSVKQKTDEIQKLSEEKINQKYNKMIKEYGGYWIVIGLYSLIVTFTLGYKEIAFKSDFQAFIGQIGTLLLNILKSPFKGGELASQWTSSVIDNSTLNLLIHSLFWFIGFMLVIGLICLIGYFVIGICFGGVMEQTEKRPKSYLLFNLLFILFLIVSATSIKSKIQFNIMYIFLIGNALWIAIIELYKYYRN